MQSTILEVSDPSQLAPPLLGAGLVHVRSCVLIPIPQVTEHSPTSIQSDHIPFTGGAVEHCIIEKGSVCGDEI